MSSPTKSLPRHTETEEASSDQENAFQPQQQPQRQPQRRPTRQRQPQRRVGQLRKPDLGNQALDTVTNTAGGIVGGVTDTLGDVTGTALDNGVLNRQQEGGGGGGGKSDTLRLRLDLNLDVEITLKARIHGDLELALLTG